MDAFVAHSPDLILVVDADGRVRYANHPESGLVSQVLDSGTTGGVEQALVRSACMRVFETGAPEPFEMGHIGPGGVEAWYRCTASPIRQSGKVSAILVGCVDITARKKLEERLRRSEALMVDTQGVAHLGTWEWDVSEPTAAWSDELYRIYGLTPEEYAPSYEAYLQMVHPEDRERVMEATTRVFEEHVPYSHDERIFRKDGTMRYLHTWAHPILDASGKLVRLVGVCQDITDQMVAKRQLEESEAQLRAFFDSSVLGICILGEDGRLQQVNPALERMLARKASDLTSHFLDAFMVPEPSVEAGDGTPAQQGMPHSAITERQFVRPDGSVFWAQITTRAITSDDGRRLAISTVEDITPWRKAEASERLAADRLTRIQELEEVSEWKSQLINIASHELKNPLTPIKIQLHLLHQGQLGPLTERQAKAVSTLSREADRLTALVHDVLDVAHVQTGRLRVDPAPHPVAELMKDVVDSFRQAASEWGVRIETDVEESLEVHADGARIQQVLFNLLSNAVRFSPQGGVVRVRAVRQGDVVQIEVGDEGPGITPDQRARLFQPFSQVHDVAEGHRGGGTGLGLYICKGIVESHGGRIDVVSEPGHGATFFFTLPTVGQEA